jgi:hypothetical protein
MEGGKGSMDGVKFNDVSCGYFLLHIQKRIYFLIKDMLKNNQRNEHHGITSSFIHPSIVAISPKGSKIPVPLGF